MRTGLHRTGMALIAMLALAAASTSVQALPAVQLWGWNGSYELGDGTMETRYWATSIPSWPADASAMAGGGYHVLALRPGGTVVSCGYNAYGQLGDGSTTNQTSPVSVSGITTAVSVAAGSIHSVARLSDDTVRCWGYNGYGSLGDGTYTDATTPVQVVTAALTPLDDVVGVAAGLYFTLAVRSDGTVWAWGDNTYGQLGDGTTTSSNVAVQVSGITTAIAVAAGAHHSLALLSDGRVMAWGYNGYSQLGDGTTTDRLTPVYVLDAPGGGHFPDVGAIAAGAWHSVYRMTDGTVWCAGYGSYGQIGNGDWATQTTPVQVPGFVAAAGQSIAAGHVHTLAIASDGKCWAWGSGSYGELGDGLGTASNTPVQTYGLSGATHIASGSSSWASFAIAETTRAATSLFTLDRTATVTEEMALRAYLKRVDTSAWIPGETVDFYIDGTWVGNGVTNGSGRADFLWTVYVGPASRTILASFLEVDDYLASSDTATATCLVWTTKLGTFDRTQRIARRTELKARLLRSDNVPIYNKGIDFSVDGTYVITRWTDVSGYARYEFYTVPDGAGAGSRTILSEWTGNDGYLAVSKTATLTVQPAQPYIWVMPKTGAAGSVLNLYGYFRRLPDMVKQEGKTLSVKVDGTWVADAVTGSGLQAGVARLLYDTSGLAVGAHTQTFEWAGDLFVDAGSGSASLTITP